MTRAPVEPRERFIRLALAVREEREQIARVVAEAQKALAEFVDRSPLMLELGGIGKLLHDFYTGIERIFEKIAPDLNGGMPAGPSWHRELLQNMTLDLPGIRPPLLRAETARKLDRFLRFRHLFRNVYGGEMEWPEVRALLEQLAAAWREADADIGRFLEFLDAMGALPTNQD